MPDSVPSSSQDDDIDVRKQLAHMKASMLAIYRKRYPSVASQQADPEPVEPEVDPIIVTPEGPADPKPVEPEVDPTIVTPEALKDLLWQPHQVQTHL